MSDFALSLFGNLDELTLANSTGEKLALPPAILGDTWIISLGFFREIEGALIARELNVQGIKVKIGERMAPPAAGGFKLRVDGADTETIDFAATESQMLEAVAGSVSVSKPAAACWIVRGPETLIASPDSVEAYNTLSPQSIVRVRGFEENGLSFFEVRLIQAPMALCDTFSRILGPQPGVDGHTELVDAGAVATDEGPALDEVQKLKIPNGFRGTYTLTHNFRRSAVLSFRDSIEQIGAALNALWSDGLTRFVVTNPESQYAYIRFVGPLGGAPQSLIVVTINTEPPGTITARLPLDKNTFATPLRAVDEIEDVPFEIEVRYLGDEEDPEDEGVVPRKYTFQTTVTCRREGIWDELALVPQHEFLRPPSDVRFEPASLGQILVGHTGHYDVAIGDGVALIFSIVHGLDTEVITGLEVCENIPNGRILAYGAEYTAKKTSDNELTLYFAGTPPSANALRVTVTGAGPESVFAAHNHASTEVYLPGEEAPDGETVQDALDDLFARMAIVEDRLGPVGADSALSIAAPTQIDFLLPDFTPFPLPPINTIAVAGGSVTRYSPLPVAVVSGLTHGADLGGAFTIDASSVANPSEITTDNPHGLVTGETVIIAGHTGSTPAIDGTHVITVTGADTFTIPVNVTVGGTGGTVTSNGQLLASGTLGEIRRCSAEMAYQGRPGALFAAGDDIVWNGRFWQRVIAPRIGTFTCATFATDDVLTFAHPHRRAVNDRIRFAGDDLPAGLAEETYYFVLTTPSTTTMTVSLTLGGAVVAITDAGTAPHTAFAGAWYPAEYEETIWGTQVTAAQLAPGSLLQVEFKPQLKLDSPNTRGLMALVIEHAQRTVEAGGHLNIDDLDWIIAKEITIELGPSTDTHRLVYRLTRALAGTLSSTAVYQNSQETLGAAQTPATADVFIRARFGQFDVQNIAAPLGSLVRSCTDIEAGIQT